jgi:hypothetical protein
MEPKNITKIIGLYGCQCHPYKDWNECKLFHFQKLEIGDKIKNRCTGKEGEIFKKYQEHKFFYTVKYGPLESDKQLEHSAQLIKLNEKIKIYK